MPFYKLWRCGLHSMCPGLTSPVNIDNIQWKLDLINYLGPCFQDVNVTIPDDAGKEWVGHFDAVWRMYV